MAQFFSKSLQIFWPVADIPVEGHRFDAKCIDSRNHIPSFGLYSFIGAMESIPVVQNENGSLLFFLFYHCFDTGISASFFDAYALMTVKKFGMRLYICMSIVDLNQGQVLFHITSSSLIS